MDKIKTAGIILAAGGSARLGRPKQLLDWFGKTFITQIIDTAEQCGLAPIIVVTGAYSSEVETSITDKQVVIAHNEHWKSGQSSSMIKGVEQLKKYSVDQFIFFLCDQPQIPVKLVNEIIRKASNKNIYIVQTTIMGKVCPPTLFKKECMDDILKLKGDQGGKVLMDKYNTGRVECSDARLLLDCDTEEDYLKLIESFSK